MLSVTERKFIQDGISQNIRNDGRQRNDYRGVSIDQGLIPQASGSARVRVGRTDVLVGVKVEIGTPLPEHPRLGRVEFAVDFSTAATPAGAARAYEDIASDLTQALTQTLGGGPSGTGAAVDLEKLGLIEGRTCWVLHVDGLVLVSDGNVLDALGFAVKAALEDTRIPRVTVIGGTNEDDLADFEVDEDTSSALHLDMDRIPVIVTMNQVQTLT
ncbi:hypothetical protein CYMTET_34279 [Cymbomonas tetramitiformis]|uniref:Ribosomal RNA-processing protein 42 n=1 Tax=Cymbomonas tetramitiformis TaxID=36881 RepID=A0AAE0FBI2_9CHLO|nr:hypothetical protein CYMTET_34279 [Cymbomonas tetramitiformis]